MTDASSGLTSSCSSAELLGSGIETKEGIRPHTHEYYNNSAHLAIDSEDVEIVESHLDDLSLEEWLRILKDSVEYHSEDPLIPESQMKFLKDLTLGPKSEQTRQEWEYNVRLNAFLFHEWSIYPEVRAVTRPVDEQEDENYHSLRVYVIGSCWGMCGAVLATFFALRYPSISLGTTSLQILIAITGKACASMPRVTIPVWKGKRLLLNSGNCWTYKEQMLATLTMSVSNGSPYAQYAIIAQSNSYFYDFVQAKEFGYMILIILSSSFMGFGFAGIFRSFLVYPSQMVWYSILPTLTLSRTLAGSEVRTKTNGWKLTRNEFFWLFTIVWFGWYWITNTAATFLQYFNWLSWIKPQNTSLNAITGVYSGLGLNPVGSFDPNIFGAFGGIMVPLESYCNWWVGYMSSFIAIVIMWWTNVRWTGYLPINSNILFDNTGAEFNVSRVLDTNTLRLSEQEYQSYSLPFWSAGTVVTYGGSFMIYTSAFVYALLNYGSSLRNGFRGLYAGLLRGNTSLSNFQDTFCRRQRRYKEVPEWWFFIILVASIGAAAGCVEGYRFTETPIWTIFLGIGIAAVFLPISGILQATTTFGFETNVLMELIVGYTVPNNPNALMVSKVFATNFFGQTENWVTNQKQAHYAGISPRSLFCCQMLSTLGTCFVQSGILTWQVDGGIPDLCSPQNPSLFTCQGVRTYFNASVLWGTIGPERVFKGLYPTLPYCFLVGALFPIPFWAARKYLPALVEKCGMSKDSVYYYWVGGLWLRHVNELIMVMATVNWAPSNITYVLGDLYICLLFQLYIRKRYPDWWSKYAYILFSAFGNGYGWAGLFDFFATQYKNIVKVDWWGNNVNAKTSDYRFEARRIPLPSGQRFGPELGHLP